MEPLTPLTVAGSRCEEPNMTCREREKPPLTIWNIWLQAAVGPGVDGGTDRRAENSRLH